MNKNVKIDTGEKVVEMPLVNDATGNTLINIETLYKETGMSIYDPGLSNTAVYKSEITYIDGIQGKLLYRGHAIEDLAQNNTYLEVAFLLLNGDLPSKVELKEFTEQIQENSSVPKNILWVIRSTQEKALPMPTLASLLMSYCTYNTDGDVYDKEYREKVVKQVLGVFPILCGLACQKLIHNEVELIEMDSTLGYAGNFLNMAFKNKAKASNSVIEKAVDFMLTIHADHEQNASTSTVRFTGSSLTNPFAALCAGICSLWGRSHGGAAIAVGHMIESIQSDSLSIKHCIERAKDKSDPFKLMGFGHRVYKTHDPRANIGREVCRKMLDEAEFKTPETARYFQIAEELEAAALNDQYFKDRNLYPNIDFYVAVMLKMVGFPIDAFTMVFVLGRSVGWIAQWKEMYEESDAKEKGIRIIRPKQIYTGKL